MSNDEQSAECDMSDVTQDMTVYHFGDWFYSHGNSGGPGGGTGE